jgi:uncharacterized repeat protein (TIGR01451 family)
LRDKAKRGALRTFPLDCAKSWRRTPGSIRIASGTMPRRFLGWILAAVLLLAALASAATAQAAATNLIPANAQEEPTDVFTDADGITAIGTSTVRGGIICIVGAAVSDPGDNSLDCDHPAFGTPNPFLGVGTFILPIQGPVLKPGTYRLLADGDADGTEPDKLSQPFTITTCDNCDPAPAQSIFADWKASAQGAADGSELACALYNTEGSTSKKKLAVALVKESLAEQPNYVVIASAVGGYVFANLTAEAPQLAQLDKWLAVLHAVTCRARDMYKAIVADPADPNYQVLTDPSYAALRPVADDDTTRLELILDAIRAEGMAELTAVQRYEGAQAASDSEWMGKQATLAGQNGLAMAQNMQAAATLIDLFADRVAAGGDGSHVVTQADVDDAQAFSDRIRTQGFTADEITELQNDGLDNGDIQDLANTFGHEVLTSAAVGTTLPQGLHAFADALRVQAGPQEEFAGAMLAVAPRQAPATLQAVVDGPSTNQLAPFAARLSGEHSRPGASPIVDYHWDFDDGGSDDGMETSHVFVAAGPHTAILTVKDLDGNTASTVFNLAGVSRDQLQLPFCGDEQNLQFNCSGFDALQPGGALTVAGSGPKQVTVKHVLHYAFWSSDLIWFKVDDDLGTIDGIAPGQPGWMSAAEGRAQIAFAGAGPVPDQIVLDVNGGDHLAFGLVSGLPFPQFLQYNPLNRPLPGIGGALELPFSAANSYRSIQVLPYRRQSDGAIQLGYEDIQGDASDYTDDIYEVSGAGVETSAELEATVDADAAKVGPGGADGYELKIHNNGPGTVILDSITDTLPSGFSYVPGSTHGATTADPQISGRTLTWAGRFAAPGGGVAGLHFAVKAAADAGIYLDEATADARGFPLTPSGPSARIEVTASAPPSTAQPSSTPSTVTAPPLTRPLVAADVIKLPSTKRCVSRRRFRIRLVQPKGVKLVSAVVQVNGKRVKVVRGRRLTAPVDLRGLPKGRFTVKITVKTSDGRTLKSARRYRTCVPRRQS